MKMVETMADKEKLSALMDGEVIDNALISELEQDPEALLTWKNYHLVGDVIRGEVPEKVEWDIAGSVAVALEDEPAHSTLTNAKLASQEATLEPQPNPIKARRQLPAWLSQLGQVAIAASVTLAVVVGVQQYGVPSQATQSEQPVQVLSTVPWGGSASPVSLTRQSLENSQENLRQRVHSYSSDFDKQMLFGSQSRQD